MQKPPAFSSHHCRKDEGFSLLQSFVPLKIHPSSQLTLLMFFQGIIQQVELDQGIVVNLCVALLTTLR